MNARNTDVENRLWIKPPLGIDDIKMIVNFKGEGIGDLCISSIKVKNTGKWITVIAAFLFFAFADLIYWYFLRENNYKNKVPAALLVSIIFFSSLPLFADYIYKGHDLLYHLTRIYELGEGIKNGHWILLIQPDLWNGYGNATPIFYNQLFLYIPAVLYCMAVPLYRCYQVYVFLINAATCMITYLCAKQLVKDKYVAVFAAMLYTLSAYRIMNVYVRAAVGEYTVMVFLPLVVYGFIKVYSADEDKITWKEYIPIVIGLTGIIGCHTLSCEMTVLFIGVTCIVLIKKTLRMKRFIALVKAAVLTLLVNLYFIVPFFESMQMNLMFKQSVNIGSDKIQGGGAYLIQVMGIFMTPGGGSANGTTVGDLPITIGFSLIMGVGVFIICYMKRSQWKTDPELLRTGIFLTGLAVLSIVLSLEAFPWNEIEKISERLAKILVMVQFPWRYLSIGTVFCVFVTAIGVKLIGKENTYYGHKAAGIIFLMTLMNVGLFYMQYADSVEGDEVFQNPERFDYLYLLDDFTWESMADRTIITDEKFVTVDDYNYEDGITTFSVKNSSDTEKTVELPLWNYDNYHAYDLTVGEEFKIVHCDNARLGVVISPGYEGSVEVRYVMPVLWKISYVLSAITAVGIIFGIVFDERRKKRRLSI